MRARLGDPAARARIRHDVVNGTPGWVSLLKGVGWENTMITRCGRDGYEGRTVAEIAREQGKAEFDAAFDILLEDPGPGDDRLGLPRDSR